MGRRFGPALAIGIAFLSVGIEPAQAADPKRGAQLYKQNTCAMCHPGGDNLMCPSRPLKGAGFLKRFPTDAAIEKVIRDGVPNTAMSGFDNERISAAEMKDIIAYIRALSPPGKQLAGSAKPPAASSKRKGKTPAAPVKSKMPPPAVKRKAMDQRSATCYLA